MRSNSYGDDLQFPVIVYSYSSKCNPAFGRALANSQIVPPRYMLSLYDIHYDISSSAILKNPLDQRLRFLDSGQYEARPFNLTLNGCCQYYEPRKWTRDDYVETARRVIGDGDVLVGFDDAELSIRDQIACQMECFEFVGRVGRRDLLLIPDGVMEAEAIGGSVEHVLDSVDMIGFPYDSLGQNTVARLVNIKRIRMVVNSISPARYIPIHVFGCLHPKAVALAFLSGADVFDGLAWMRSFIDGMDAYTAEEYELRNGIARDWMGLEPGMLLNNIFRLEALASDLACSVTLRIPGDMVWTLPILEEVINADKEVSQA